MWSLGFSLEELNMVSMASKYDDKLVKKVFTVESFLNNPTGDKGSNAMSRRLAYDSFVSKVHGLIQKQKKFITKYFLCDGILYIRVNVPSESLDITYDVVFSFKVGKSLPTGNGLIAIPVRFFSNAPSFTYTYAYAFNMYGMIPTELKSKLSKESLVDFSKIRNPDLQSFYEKSITLALIYLRENGLFNTHNISTNLMKISTKRFVDSLKSAYDKETEYKQKNAEEVTKRKKERAAKKKIADQKKEKAKENNKKINATGKTSMKINNKIDMRVDTKISMRVKK